VGERIVGPPVVFEQLAPASLTAALADGPQSTGMPGAKNHRMATQTVTSSAPPNQRRWRANDGPRERDLPRMRCDLGTQKTSDVRADLVSTEDNRGPRGWQPKPCGE